MRAGVGEEAVLVQGLCDVVPEVCDGVDHSGLLGGSWVVLLHHVVVEDDEVHRVVADACAVHLQGDGIVD